MSLFASAGVERQKAPGKMAKQIQCTVTITEIDGKLSIMTNIPDGAEKSIAAALALALVGRSREIMNEVLGANEVVQKMATN